MSIPNHRGIYLLMINVLEDVKIYLKSGKEWIIPRGIYYYVGSAKGPGGLRARINRHLRGEKKASLAHRLSLDQPGVYCYTCSLR